MGSARSILVVYTKPVVGREKEFDRWYSEVHLPEILRLGPFVAARRFRFAPAAASSPRPDLPYLAIYEIEAGRLREAQVALAEALEASRLAVAHGETPVLATSDALDPDRKVAWFEEIIAIGPPADHGNRT